MPDLAKDLCVSCGLCCDGSLFWAVSLPKDDPAPVKRDENGKLRQPCPHLDGLCTIYSRRPVSCRTFNCKVLTDVQSGQSDMTQAQSIIAEMRSILAALDESLPRSDKSIFHRAATFATINKAKLDDPFFKLQNRDLLNSLELYQTALAQFRNNEEGQTGPRT
jgi:Fe-S-cluster containining protein